MMDSFPGDGLAVVFGASGGIGSALESSLSASGRFERVLGLSRHSAPALDITCSQSVEAAAAVIAGSGLPLRLAIVATGFLHGPNTLPEKSWRSLEPESLAQSFAVNAIGPALLMRHVLPLLAPSGRAVFAALSARVGSIGDNRLGGWYGYRASKAALNQLVRTASIELARLRPEAACIALHPGTVETRLSAPFARSGLDIQTPEAAARRLLAVIDRLTAAETGRFFDHRGEGVPW